MVRIKEEPRQIEIVSFLNPHVFYFKDSRDSKKRLQLKELLQSHVGIKMVDFYDKRVLIYNEEQNTFQRADVQFSQTCTVTENRGERITTAHVCWLVDEGKTIETDAIYYVPPHFAYEKFPDFAKRGCLLNVVPKAALPKIAESPRGGKKSKSNALPGKEFEADVMGAVQQFMQENVTFAMLKTVNIVDNVEIGKVTIAIKSSPILYDLADKLIEMNMVKKDKIYFQKMMSEYIYTDMESITRELHYINCSTDDALMKIRAIFEKDETKETKAVEPLNSDDDNLCGDFEIINMNEVLSSPEDEIALREEKRLILYLYDKYMRYQADSAVQEKWHKCEDILEIDKDGVFKVKSDDTGEVLDKLVVNLGKEFKPINIMWEQNLETVKITCNLSVPVLEDSTIQLACEKLVDIRGTSRGDFFKTTLFLYDAVEEVYKYTQQPYQIIVKFTKKNKGEWPRLLNCTRSRNFLSN